MWCPSYKLVYNQINDIDISNLSPSYYWTTITFLQLIHHTQTPPRHLL
jgi:hypothetical protein